MTDYYVDSGTGSDGNSGLSQSLALATIEYALETIVLAAGDAVWVRRGHVEYSGDATSTLRTFAIGTPDLPIILIGWPRPNITDSELTEASWVNGSRAVQDIVISGGLSKTKHAGRFLTAPDGKMYLIEHAAGDYLYMDRNYAGPGVSGVDGKFYINEDEKYADRPSDVNNWDSDTHELPLINFKYTSYYFYLPHGYWQFYYLCFQGQADLGGNLGVFYIGPNAYDTFIQGCIFYPQGNTPALYVYSASVFDRILIYSNALGGKTAQNGIYNLSPIKVSNSTIHALGGSGIYALASYKLQNVNIGVFQSNKVHDIAHNINKSIEGFGSDVRLGSTFVDQISFLNRSTAGFMQECAFENYQKELGSHFFKAGNIEATSKVVQAGSGDPYKRTDGANKILEVSTQVDSNYSTVLLFEHEFEVGTVSKSYRYYVQCKDLTLSATELWLECDFVNSYSDTTEYTMFTIVSDEVCGLRTGPSDWATYIEVTGIQPAVESKVRIKCFVRKYDSDGYFYIDPLVVIS